jgi:superfamily II DNA or RNA helicase
MTSLTNKGYCIVKDQLNQDDLEHIYKELTVKPYNMMDSQNDSKEFIVYKQNSKKIYIPKAYGLKYFGEPDNNNLLDNIQKIDLKFNGSLRDEQHSPVEKFVEAAKHPEKRGGIINVRCGFGKTNCALYIISELKVKSMVVVHKEFLINQWKERIEQFLPSARVGYIKGPVCDVEDKDIIIASLQSLSMKKYEPSVFYGIGLTIFDEVHHTAAEVFSRVFNKATTLYTLGLSATVNRKDGLTKVFKWHIGDIIFRNTAKKDSMKVIMKEYYDTDYRYCQECFMFNKKPNMSKMINNICDHIPRIEFVIQCLKDLLSVEPNRKVLILSDRRRHLELFKDLLAKENIDSGFYYGGLKQDVLNESETKQILLGTYAYVSEGFDMRGLNTMILASPKSDVIQSVGRILRDKIEDRAYQSLVIDIVDKFSVFGNQARKRVKYYKSQGYEIEDDKLFDEAKIIKMDKTCYIQDLE